MNQAVTVSPKTIEEILTRLDRLTKEVRAIKARLFGEAPPYGTDKWWEKEIEEGLGEVKQGKYKIYNNAKDLLNDLHSGR